MTVTLDQATELVAAKNEAEAKFAAVQKRYEATLATVRAHEAKRGAITIDAEQVHAELDLFLEGKDNTLKTMLAQVAGAKTPAHIAAEKRLQDVTPTYEAAKKELDATIKTLEAAFNGK